MSRHRLPRRSGHVDAQRPATGVYSRRRAPAPAVYRQALAYAAPVATFDALGGFEAGIGIQDAEARSLFPFQDVTSGADPRDCRELPARGPLRGKTTTPGSPRQNSRLRRMTRPRRHSLPVARGPCDRSALRLPDKPGSQQHSWP
jgi:hypothetical protein